MTATGTRVRAERRQRRLDKKRREALPLFAAAGDATLDSIAPLPTVSVLEQEERQRQARTCASALKRQRMSLRSWLRYRAIAERYITGDQVRAMETYCRNVLPDSMEYRADYWWQMLCECGLIAGKGRLTPTAAMWRRGTGE